MPPRYRSKSVRRDNPSEAGLSRLKIILTTYCSAHAHFDFVRPFLGALRANDWVSVYRKAVELSTAVYSSATEHLVANQLSAFVLKFPASHTSFGLEKSPRDKAIETFIAGESRCRISNKRLRLVRLGRKNAFSTEIARMQDIIARVLGPLDLEKIYELCGWGPGSNIGVSGNATSYARKLSSVTWSSTPTCLPYFISAVKRNYHIAEFLCETRGDITCLDDRKVVSGVYDRVQYVDYNKVMFVPKTAKTERSIAVEPVLNSFVQKGIDLYMRGCLLRAGCDLTDQGKNKHLARVGSIDSSLCTLDLSAASDSISLELCKLLLPPDWFTFLDCCRSPSYLLGNDTPIRYEKFVSMGNGFCFPLETLIFLAAVRSSSEVKVTHAVYGDDIIVESHVFPRLKRLLNFLGFKLNDDKTFVSGPFRESCGADWYRGQDVRPVYVKSLLSEFSDIMALHNAMLRSQMLSSITESVREELRLMVDARHRFVRPDNLHYPLPNRFDELHHQRNLNGAFTVPLDIFMSSRFASWDRHEMRWRWREFIFSPKADIISKRKHLAYISFLLGVPGGQITLRRKVKLRTIVK